MYHRVFDIDHISTFNYRTVPITKIWDPVSEELIVVAFLPIVELDNSSGLTEWWDDLKEAISLKAQKSIVDEALYQVVYFIVVISFPYLCRQIYRFAHYVYFRYVKKTPRKVNKAKYKAKCMAKPSLTRCTVVKKKEESTELKPIGDDKPLGWCDAVPPKDY